MDYQSGTATVAGIATTTAGVAVLPNTGNAPILTYVAIAAIVTGSLLVTLQVSVWAYKQFNR